MVIGIYQNAFRGKHVVLYYNIGTIMYLIYYSIVTNDIFKYNLKIK